MVGGSITVGNDCRMLANRAEAGHGGALFFNKSGTFSAGLRFTAEGNLAYGHGGAVAAWDTLATFAGWECSAYICLCACVCASALATAGSIIDSPTPLTSSFP